jgi:TolB-like protein/tRNA A-37 threonylcarbamoyl transferase component Bud32/lipoprotein NlpI
MGTEMSIECPECHFENTSDSKFCKQCGALLRSVQGTDPTNAGPDSYPIDAGPDPQPGRPSGDIPDLTKTMEAPKEELTTGSTFAARYQIIEELGKGGMGRVYKAHDTKIKEKIALKLINPEIAKDKKTIERFSNELRLARKIRHKNVCGMFDLGEEKGTHYITMEFVPGEDLRSSIRRFGQLPIGKSISIAKQICEGLVEAHRLGVIHRDLKSNNIMIDKEGNVRVMDFGIARSLEAKGITGAGVMIGTPEYMSPEQVEGKDVDQRSDIYSLGVILYEMVTGRVPFEGDTPFTIGVKHKSETPKDPKKMNSQIPEELSRVILKCLEKDKDKRFQSAGEVRLELTGIEEGIPTIEREIPLKKPITSKEITVSFGLKNLLIPALVVIVIAAAAVIIWQLLPQKEPVYPPPEQKSIAVLPFEDLSAQKDQEHFCDGMTEAIIAKLSGIEELKKVISRTSVMRYKGTEKDIKQIGQELGVSTILEGSIQKEKDNIRLIAKLINVKDDSQIWSETYDRKLVSVFDIQSDMAEKIAGALAAEISPAQKKRMEKKPTENLEAYNLYLKGRFFWNKRTGEDIFKAIEYFEQAIEVDSDYALAYAGISDSYIVLPDYTSIHPKESFSKAEEMALRALEIDSELAETYTSLAQIKARDYNWSAAEQNFKQAIELNPNYATAHHWYAHNLLFRKRFEEAVEEIDRAVELDPLSLVISRNAGQIYYYAGQYDRAMEWLYKVMEIDPDFSYVHFTLGLVYWEKSMLEEAVKEIRKEKELTRGDSPLESILDAFLGWYSMSLGKKDKTKELLNNLLMKSQESYVPPTSIASLYFTLGENDQGFEWLEKAYQVRDWFLSFIKINSLYDPVRTDPRFKLMLKKMNLDE